MRSKSLNILFAIMKILTIIPFNSTTKTANILQKLYFCILMSITTFLTITSLINNGWYSNFNHIKMTVNILIHLNSLIFNFDTTMSVIFWKKTKWQNFLEKFNHIITNNNNRVERNATVAIVSIFVAFLGIIWIYYFWANYFIATYYFPRYNVVYFHFFLLFVYSTFISFLTSLIYLEYKQLNEVLCKDFSKTKFNLIIKTTEQSFLFLKDVVDIFNDIFGWPLALIILYTTLYLLNNFDFMFIATAALPESIGYRLIADCSMVLIIFVSNTLLRVFGKGYN